MSVISVEQDFIPHFKVWCPKSSVYHQSASSQSIVIKNMSAEATSEDVCHLCKFGGYSSSPG